MKHLFISLVFVFIGDAHASKTLIVSSVKGSVQIEGQSQRVKKGDVLLSNQVLVSQDVTSRLQLNWETGRTVLSGKFKLQLKTLHQSTNQPTVLELIYGKIRLQTRGKSKAEPLKIITPVAVAGVRGTDFMVSHDELLGESEIICFESEVDFKDGKSNKSVIVGAGQWGGVGLRFGELRDPLTLPPKILSAIDKSIPYEAP